MDLKDKKKQLTQNMQYVTSIADLARLYYVSRQCMHERIKIYGLESKWKLRLLQCRIAIRKQFLARCSKGGSSGTGSAKRRSKQHYKKLVKARWGRRDSSDVTA